MTPRDFELSLFPSRSSIELGEPWELLLRIVNHSSNNVWATSLTTTSTLPAELRHPSYLDVASDLTTFPSVPGSQTPELDTVCIPPGGELIAQWRHNHDKKTMAEAKFRQRVQWHMFFHPGDYQVQAHVRLWEEQPDIKKVAGPSQRPKDLAQGADQSQATPVPDDDEQLKTGPPDAVEADTEIGWLLSAKRLQTEELAKSMCLSVTSTIEVVTRSMTIFLAAAFGGFLAFALRELHSLYETPDSLSAKDFLLLPTYILLGVIITLIISRVTEAKFPLTIKIMDFWGATALGILSALGGQYVVAKLISAMIG